MPLIFTYGTLRRGEHNHGWLESSKFVAEDSIEAYLVQLSLPFPAITEGLGLVVGEVYEVTDDVRDKLDLLEGHPFFYVRKTVTTTAGRVVETYFGNAVLAYAAGG